VVSDDGAIAEGEEASEVEVLDDDGRLRIGR